MCAALLACRTCMPILLHTTAAVGLPRSGVHWCSQFQALGSMGCCQLSKESGASGRCCHAHVAAMAQSVTSGRPEGKVQKAPSNGLHPQPLMSRLLYKAIISPLGQQSPYLSKDVHLLGVGALLLAKANDYTTLKSVVWHLVCAWLSASWAYTLLVPLTNVDESPVVLYPLEGTAFGELFLVLLGHLGRLTAHLTGTSQRSVDLACTSDHR